jgi:hypothetical protein
VCVHILYPYVHTLTGTRAAPEDDLSRPPLISVYTYTHTLCVRARIDVYIHTYIVCVRSYIYTHTLCVCIYVHTCVVCVRAYRCISTLRKHKYLKEA